MKTSQSALNAAISQKPNALIQLVANADDDEIPVEHSTQFLLSSRPAVADQSNVAKFKTKCRILQGEENVQQLVNWYRQACKVLHGLNITDNYGDAVPVLETMLNGTPLTLFKDSLVSSLEEARETRRQAIDGADVNALAALEAEELNIPENQHWNQVDRALRHMLTELMPRRALAKIKRYIRRECRKPSDMLVRKYYQRVLRLNVEILPNLPPFEANQQLGMDEILDIVLFGTPKSWQTEMERQGFDPLDHTIGEVVDFMERIEATENHDKNSKTVPNKTAKTGKKKSPNHSSQGNGNGKGDYHCSHHGDNKTHNSDQCFVLHPELKKKGNKNKSWSRKASESKSDQKELMAFVKKQVASSLKKTVKEELAAFSKKKASKRKSVDCDSSDDDLNAFDRVQDLDYKTFEKLVIDDKFCEDESDDISV